jgi:hypothetical protein
MENIKDLKLDFDVYFMQAFRRGGHKGGWPGAFA